MSAPKPPIVLEIDPADMALRGRIGGFAQKARHDPKQTTAAGRATFLARFERDVDPDGVLPEAERQRRATSAKKAYFARLAYLSAKARQERQQPQPAGTGPSAAAEGGA
jgi:hypothetical protein